MRYFFCFLILSCSNSITPPAAVTTDIDYCSKADENLQKLGCISNKYTKKGKSYTEFCTELQNKGIFTNPKCVASLTDCADFTADTCNRDN